MALKGTDNQSKPSAARRLPNATLRSDSPTTKGGLPRATERASESWSPSTRRASTVPRELSWQGAALSAESTGAPRSVGPRVAKLQFALGPEYFRKANVASTGQPQLDGRYGFRTEAAVCQLQADLARAVQTSFQKPGVADAHLSSAVYRYAALPGPLKQQLPEDVRTRLNAFVRRSNVDVFNTRRVSQRLDAVLPHHLARRRVIESMPANHGLTIASKGTPDDQGGFTFELKNKKEIVGEMHIDRNAVISRIDRPVELDPTAALAAHGVAAFQIPLQWTGTALRAVSGALEGKIPKGAHVVLKDLAEIDYQGALSVEGLKAPWPSMFSVWGFERSPPQLGVYSVEKDKKGNDTTYVTISREDFAHDLRSRPTYRHAIEQFRAQHPDLTKAKPGDSITTHFQYTGPGMKSGDYAMLETFLGSYSMKVTFRGLDEETRKPRFDFMVENKTHWESGTRIAKSWQDQGWPPYLIENYERGRGMFGNITQRYIWSDLLEA
jgi:hypothetical protein